VSPDHPARPRVGHLDAIHRLTILITVRDFEARPFWHDVGDVEHVGMPQTVGPQRLSVVVHHDRTERDFFAPIAIEIVNVHAVRALSAHGRIGVVAKPSPRLHELAVNQIPGVHVHEGVGPARDQDAQSFSVELRDADLVSVDTIPAIVAPAHGIAAFDPVSARDFLPRHAVQNGDVLRPFEDKPAIGDGRVLPGRRVRRHLQRDLGLPVAIEITGNERRPPDAHVHVPAEVVAPHERAGPAVVGLQLEGVGLSRMVPGSSPCPSPGCLMT
jgi:hypothetical protein